MGWADVVFIFCVAAGAQFGGELFARRKVLRDARAALEEQVALTERNLAAAEKAATRAPTGHNRRTVEALTAEAARLAAARVSAAIVPTLVTSLLSAGAFFFLSYLYAGARVAALPFDPTWAWPRAFFSRGVAHPFGEDGPAASYLPFYVLASAPVLALRQAVLGPSELGAGAGGVGGAGAGLARVYAQARKQAEEIVARGKVA